MLRLAVTSFAVYAFVAALCMPAVAREREGGVWHRNVNVAWKTAQTTQRPLLVFVTMNGCAHCVRMDRETYNNMQVVSEIRRSVEAATVEASRDPVLVRRLGVRSFPATFLIGPGAQVLSSINGYVEPAVFRDWLRTTMQTRVSMK